MSDHSKTTKESFSLKSENSSYNLTIITKGEEITFKFEDLKEFPIKLYELKMEFEKFRQLDENIFMFKKSTRFIDAVKSFIKNEKYSISYDQEENAIIFEIKNEIFENGGAKIKIPEKEQDINAKVESLTKTVSELRKEIQAIKFKELEKDEAAVKSFKYSSFLKDEEKKLISKWIHPKKIIRFNMLFSTDKDGDSTGTFHYYCDGIFPTVTVVVDTSGRRFGGFSTQNWCQSTVGGNYSRAQGSFIFNLSNSQKYDLIDQLNNKAINRNNSYGPYFGGGPDFYLANQCRSNSSSNCNKNSYNSGNTNLLGLNGQTSFQVSCYEVYQVIFE